MKFVKTFLIIFLLSLGINIFQTKLAVGDVVDCGAAGNTCWVFDTIEEVKDSGIAASNLYLEIKGKVGSTSHSVLLGLPFGKDPIFQTLLTNCQKLALLAQVSPEKVKFRIDSFRTTSNEILLTDLSADTNICHLVTH